MEKGTKQSVFYRAPISISSGGSRIIHRRERQPSGGVGEGGQRTILPKFLK